MTSTLVQLNTNQAMLVIKHMFSLYARELPLFPHYQLLQQCIHLYTLLKTQQFARRSTLKIANCPTVINSLK